MSPLLSLPPIGSFHLLHILSSVLLTSVAPVNHNLATRGALIPSSTLTAKMMLMLSRRQLTKELEKGSNDLYSLCHIPCPSTIIVHRFPVIGIDWQLPC